MSHSVPSYRRLPELGDLGVRHSWGILPPGCGTLAFIGPEQTADAARLVRSGQTIPVNLPIDAFDPPLFGREPVRHRVNEPTRVDTEDVLDNFNPQSSSQLDGLAHVRAREHGFYGGILTLEDARKAIGIHHAADRGIATRGVLLDMVPFDRARGITPFDGEMYDADTLERAAKRAGVEIRRGDVVLVRTGWAAEYLTYPPEAQAAIRAWNGLRPDEAMAEWLWDHGVAVIGTDNPAVESAPGSREIGSLHRRLLPALGMSMMELLDLERLSRACAEAGRWEFFFVCVPLNLPGGVSSPANAMAVL